ncbi:UDP-N-acetylmuramoyl-tripeptide--D-alanyl-D-alanine ligase [Pectinatus sottacetonis]|uniref:UDP-N-acetylmuramoyl-tripeptide--D-alanyl-D- alanine ligase n=1 Tax=Pectinatus sottacetonis TaxID=1002795 RepID=UPI0018C710EF|nr:UDP-N-acetylmuramoyl-tripeptide--D-alanyl-D-alanine ligase [Pectinatus sottacetonis]
MPFFTLEQLKKCTDCKVLSQSANKFSAISTDTRTIKKGMVFLAIRGEKFDGHNFIKKAIEKGAAGIIISEREKAENFIQNSVTIMLVEDTLQSYINIAGSWRDQFKIPVIAITGSNGKTTTKDLAAALLSVKYNVLKTQKNFNSEIGMALTLLSLEQQYQAAVIEIGMRGLGQIRTLAKAAKPDIGVVLNIGQTHMELLGSQENIARAKGELVEAIKPGGKVILNADDKYVDYMIKKSQGKVITFAIYSHADIRAENIQMLGNNKTRFECIMPNGRVEVTIPLIGIHNVYDALAAIAIGYEMHLNVEDIQRGFDTFKPSGMRFEILQVNGYTLINDAYNASPASMKAAIDNLLVMTAKKRIVVFGDMKELGSIEKSAHREIGTICANKNINVLITLGELARYAGISARAENMKNVYMCAAHEEIVSILNDILEEGDIVLIKGSHSMHMEKIINLLEK